MFSSFNHLVIASMLEGSAKVDTVSFLVDLQVLASNDPLPFIALILSS